MGACCSAGDSVYSVTWPPHHGLAAGDVGPLWAEGSLRVRMMGWWRDSTRLETRTKESSVPASRRV